jgi:hypothetical protein
MAPDRNNIVSIDNSASGPFQARAEAFLGRIMALIRMAQTLALFAVDRFDGVGAIAARTTFRRSDVGPHSGAFIAKTAPENPNASRFSQLLG